MAELEHRINTAVERKPLSAFLSMPEPEHGIDTVVERRPKGWKAMPYILGTETITRLAMEGLQANFYVYLIKVYHMEPVQAVYVIFIWSSINGFAPLAGAIISDAKLGCLKTIAIASFASLTGLVMLTLSAWLPTLHPPSCSTGDQMHGKCKGASSSQVAFLAIALGFLSIGAGGVKPCNVPFGVNQFDQTTEKGRKGIKSFYNWYYTSYTVAQMIASTVIVYIQHSVGWVLGFVILTLLMASSIALYFLGSRIYVHVSPNGSIFSSILQVIVAAYQKRNIVLPRDELAGGVFYDPPVADEQSALMTRLPRTEKYRCLNKAAIVLQGDLGLDGSPTNKWRLVSIQQIEEVKCLIKIMPIWASGIIIFIPMLQERTFLVAQAIEMDRHLGPHFQIPPGSIPFISSLAIAMWVPFYRIVVYAIRKVTHIEGGTTQLQRIGAGGVLSVLAMIVAGAVEQYRRNSAVRGPPMSAMWLTPQLILLGLSERFNVIGQIDFYNSEFPYHMKSMGNSLVFLSTAIANYLSILTVKIAQNGTGGYGRGNWLPNHLNNGRLDLYFYLLAGVGAFNLGLFLFAAIRYRYNPVHAHACREAEQQLG